MRHGWALGWGLVLAGVVTVWCVRVARGEIGTRSFEQHPDAFDGVEMVLSLVHIRGSEAGSCRVTKGTLDLLLDRNCPSTAEATVRGAWSTDEQRFVVAEIHEAPDRDEKKVWSALAMGLAGWWFGRALRRTPDGWTL